MSITDRLGQQLGNYCLVRFLGQGGFADVYLGEHIFLGTLAALKIVRASVVGNDITHFYTEARTVAHLIHPHIVRVLEFGVQDAVPYLVMDYASGGTIRTLHPKGHPLPLDTVRSYVDQVAAALQYAHQQKIVHRDVKPENMLLGKYNEVLLSDFGIALITQSSQITRDLAGTVAYMAPEQIRSHPRPASDQYSLGIVVYEWLTGERPFDGSFTELAVKHSVVPPPPLREKVPTIPYAVEQVVLTALAKEPDQRFRCVQDFAIAFAQACRSPRAGQGSGTLGPPFSPSQVQSQQLPSLPPTDSSLNLSIQQSRPLPSQTPHLLNPSIQQPHPLPPQMSHSLNPSIQQSHPLSSQISHSPNPSMQQPRPLPSEVPHLRKRGVSRRDLIGDGFVMLIALAASGTVWDFLPHSSTDGENSDPRLLYMYTGHSHPVWSVAWSPDGKRIASASADDTVQVWNAANGANPYIYHGHSSTVYAAAWSPDGKYIASADYDGIVRVWGATNGANVYTYKDHINWVRAVVWSPDGKDIASAGSDQTVRVWGATNGANVYTYKGYAHPVQAVAWSPDGKRIASAGGDDTVQVWDATNGASISTYNRHTNWVLAVAWSPDGKYVASGGDDKTVQVWDAINGASIYTYKGHSRRVWSVAWSPDGKRIASASGDGTVQVWDATNGANVYTYKGHSYGNEVLAVAWSPDGKRIASAGGDNTVQVWQST